MRSMHHINILLVEDSESDVRLVDQALKDSNTSSILHVSGDGVDALRFLRRKDAYVDAQRPDLILLDLNMPRKDGRETLAEIKSDVELKSIPVVILTTSDAPEDLAICYRNHCNCFLTKPMDLDGFNEVIRRVDQYWAQTVRLPHSSHALSAATRHAMA